MYTHISHRVASTIHTTYTNMVHKSRGDYFKAAIPMMPEENKAIASFSRTTRSWEIGAAATAGAVAGNPDLQDRPDLQLSKLLGSQLERRRPCSRHGTLSPPLDRICSAGSRPQFQCPRELHAQLLYAQLYGRRRRESKS